jgi:L-seryl-tRNA(Ser) seleniumtransferase
MAIGSDPQLPARPNSPKSKLRSLPSVDAVLQTDSGRAAMAHYGDVSAVEAVREVLEHCRQRLIAGEGSVPDETAIADEAVELLDRVFTPTLRPVINASGVILHTNLGRAPLSDAALEAAVAVGRGYSSLEYDLDRGTRGSRTVHSEQFLTRLTGAESALVVNNNAAAVLLMLTALCQGRRVIVSRGQLVEIGGGFRVPDVMRQSGALLVEVGTTNRTHLTDYEGAIDDNTAAILVAHHSNFKIIGFTSEPALGELVTLAQRRGLHLLYDQGSGALLDTSPYGLDKEPTVIEGLRAGADVVAFSGDKLLGGPQAGILCGRRAAIEQMRRHPLARAVRADKLALSALAATLGHYVAQNTTALPVWYMISRPLEEIDRRAREWADRFLRAGIDCRVEDGLSAVGGGSLPGSSLTTRVVAVEHPKVDALASAMRQQRMPIVGRIVNDRLALDPRTVLPGQDADLVFGVIEAVRAVAQKEE